MGDLINLGELSKPATVLIEKVCNAVGVVYEPTRIRRRAKAEADAQQIVAAGQLEVDELQRRALVRLLQQEARKQVNIEQITAEAARSLPPTAQVESLDEDWVAHFFKQCDTVSDSEMQSLWSRLLAGEATSPGTFSRRTVDLVSTFDKADAALFTAFGQFVWLFGSDPQPIIYDIADEAYRAVGITFESLKHLDAIGLISFEPLGGYQRTGFQKQGLTSYHGRLTMLEFHDGIGTLEMGTVLLTSVGKQLFSICGSQRNERFYEYVIRRWCDVGVVPFSLVLQKTNA